MGGLRGVIRPGVNFAAHSTNAGKPQKVVSDGHGHGQQPPGRAGGGANMQMKVKKKKTREVGGGGGGDYGDEDPEETLLATEKSAASVRERDSGAKKDKRNHGKKQKGSPADDDDDDEAAADAAEGAEEGGTESGGGGGDEEEERGGDNDNDNDNDKKKKKNKKLRQQQLMAHLSLRAEATTPVVSRDHPFEVDAADHCETPFQAYQDIEPFLFRVALALKKPKEKLRIYDPYFCEGSVAKHLARLGFTNVYNANEDFYKCIEEKRIPDHDVLLTNPPYSGDHFRRILSFCGKSKKPWLLLLPNFVCRKQYYQPAIGGDGVKPLFLIPDPLKPYRYWAPGRRGFEERNQAKGTTPFETFWYVELAGLAPQDEVRAWWLKKYAPHSTCALPNPDEALPQQQRLQKRGNPRARKIAAQREREEGRDGGGGGEAGRSGGGRGGGRGGGGGIYYDPEKAKKASKIRDRHQGGSAVRRDGGQGKKRSGDMRGRGGRGGDVNRQKM